MLTGKHPFERSNMSAVLLAILEQPPPVDGLDPALASIVCRALAKDRTHRYDNCRELLADLEGCKPIIRRRAERAFRAEFEGFIPRSEASIGARILDSACGNASRPSPSLGGRDHRGDSLARGRFPPGPFCASTSSRSSVTRSNWRETYRGACRSTTSAMTPRTMRFLKA